MIQRDAVFDSNQPFIPPPPPHPRPQLFFYYLMWVERSFSCTSEAFHWYNQIHTQDVNHACRHSNDSRDSFWWKSHVVLFWTWRDRDNDDSYSSQYTKRWKTGQGGWSWLPPARTSVVDVLYPRTSQILDWCLKYDNIHIKVSLVYQRLVEWLRCWSTKWGYSATSWSMGSILVTFFIAITQSVCPGPSKLGQSMFQSSIDTFQK